MEDDYSKDDGDDSVSCEELGNKKIISHFIEEARSEIGVFETADTSNMFLVNGHFTDKNSTQTLVWIEAYGLPSSGDGSNLLMLFSCGKNAKMIFCTTCGVFSKNDIRDLNGDGLSDMISESSIDRMGECHDDYRIFNLKDIKMNLLYEARNDSYICDSSDNYDFLKRGDTIERSISHQLTDKNNDHVFEIRQVRKITTFYGGKTKSEIAKREKTTVDSCIIPLKK